MLTTKPVRLLDSKIKGRVSHIYRNLKLPSYRNSGALQSAHSFGREGLGNARRLRVTASPANLANSLEGGGGGGSCARPVPRLFV